MSIEAVPFTMFPFISPEGKRRRRLRWRRRWWGERHQPTSSRSTRERQTFRDGSKLTAVSGYLEPKHRLGLYAELIFQCFLFCDFSWRMDLKYWALYVKSVEKQHGCTIQSQFGSSVCTLLTAHCFQTDCGLCLIWPQSPHVTAAQTGLAIVLFSASKIYYLLFPLIMRDFSDSRVDCCGPAPLVKQLTIMKSRI